MLGEKPLKPENSFSPPAEISLHILIIEDEKQTTVKILDAINKFEICGFFYDTDCMSSNYSRTSEIRKKEEPILARQEHAGDVDAVAPPVVHRAILNNPRGLPIPLPPPHPPDPVPFPWAPNRGGPSARKDPPGRIRAARWRSRDITTTSCGGSWRIQLREGLGGNPFTKPSVCAWLECLRT